ncbi:MAG: hypothetical protein ACKO7A_08560, partial [Microcystis sp.]
AWLKNRRLILVWCCICFLLFAKYGYFWGSYWEFLDNRAAMQAAIARIDSRGSVLTTTQIAPHLTHRPNLQLVKVDSTESVVSHLIGGLQRSHGFKLSYAQDQVFLLKQRQERKSSGDQ